MSKRRTNMSPTPKIAKEQPVPAAVPARGQAVAAPLEPPLPARDIVMICLFSVLLLVAMTVTTGRMTMVLLLIALAVSIGKLPLRRMGERCTVPVLGLAFFALMNGLAALYSDFGSYAVSELYKFLAAFAVAWILLTRFEKKHVRGLLWGVAAVCGIIAVLCVDAAGTAQIFHAFEALVGLLGGTFQDVVQTPGVRVNGIYNDANVSAAILALGALVSLYLALTERKLWRRGVACFLLGLSAQVFFLSLSRGAILCFGLTLVVWLALAGQDRLRLFLLMFVSAVVTVLLAFPAMATLDGTSFIPTALTLVTGIGIFAGDLLISAPLSRVLEGKGKAVAVVVLILGVAIVGYGVAAVTVTGPYTLSEGERLNRTVSLEAGAYTVSGDWDGALQVLVYSQDEMQQVNSTSTTLFNGLAEEAVFTVPEGEGLRITVRLSYAEGGGEVRSVVFSDGTQLPLDYPLLPDFVAVRLQDSLLSSSSFSLRVQYMKDAWTLFTQSPLVGHGLGSTQGLYTSVQPFYYESLYVHSHILQIMSDMGLLGLTGFLAMMGGVLWFLLKAWKGAQDPLATMLVACWVMMNSHSLMEINFSIRAFQCAAYVLLMAAVLCYAEPLSRKAVKLCGWVVSGAFWLYTAVFGGLVLSHRMVEREAAALDTNDAYEFMDSVRSFVTRDVFVREDYQLNFVRNAVVLDSSYFNTTALLYVQELRESGTYNACSGLARYYYLPLGEFEEMFQCSREGIAQVASDQNAWNMQLDFYREAVLIAVEPSDLDVYFDGVQALEDYLEEYNAGRMDQIQLTEENQAFLALVDSVRESGLSNEDAYVQLLTGGTAGSETGEQG